MIWKKPGHELDKIGNGLMGVKNLRFFGFDETAKKMFDFVKWLGIENDFDIKFIWDETEHEGEAHPEYFCGKKVIVYNGESNLQDIIADNDNTVVVMKDRGHTRRVERLRRVGVERIFYMNPSRLGIDNFVQNFICIYMMYKYEILVSHWTNYLITTRCNLNCKYCLNFNEYLKRPVDVSMDSFEQHFKILFEKFDYLYSLHLTGGETQLTRDLPEKIRFLKQYKERIYDFFVITNGTIVPSEGVLEAVKSMNGWFLIDDYSETVPQSKICEITKKMDAYRVGYTVSKAHSWFDLSVDKYSIDNCSNEALIQHKDKCHNYLHEFAEGNIYSCCYQQYAYRAGKGVLDDGDYISIKEKSKMEILEFRQGYSINGFTSLCKHCRGLGDTAKMVGVAEQINKKG